MKEPNNQTVDEIAEPLKKFLERQRQEHLAWEIENPGKNYEEERQKERLERELALRTEKVERMFKLSGVSARHAHNLSVYKVPRVVQAIEGQLTDGMILVLIGNRGTGKTQAATWLIRKSVEAEIKSLYITALSLFLEIRETYNRPGPKPESLIGQTVDKVTESQVVQKYVNVPFLVIDEIQDRSESDFEDRILTHIIDQRYGAMMETVLIGNLTPKNLRRHLGESITDRIMEVGKVIEMNGRSYRQQ
jgi:DNA replication protein DnaC